VAVDVDDDVVTLCGAEFDGLVVLPRQHVGGLEELALSHQARVLAALKRARRVLRDRQPGSASRVVVMSDPPATHGHVCYGVLPVANKQ
jgi:hypothetical protein